MVNIIIVEGREKYNLLNIKEAVEQFLGEDFYKLSNEEKYIRIRMKTIMNAYLKNKKVKDLKKGEVIKDVRKEQYIIYDEEIFFLSLAKNNDIVIYEKEDANLFAKNINKDNLERVSKRYIRINDCVNELIENKLKNINL